MLKCDVMYSENVAKTYSMAHRAQNPTEVYEVAPTNMTRGLRGALVAGVMTGGAKNPWLDLLSQDSTLIDCFTSTLLYEFSIVFGLHIVYYLHRCDKWLCHKIE